MSTVSRVDEKLGFGKSTILGMQHVAVMYGGAVAVPILIANALGLSQEELVFLISFDLFTCGLVSLIQTLGLFNMVGAKLPALMAISFVVVGPAISIGLNHGGGTVGLTYILGGVIGSGVLVAILSFFAESLIKFFPPIVTGSVVLVIGITLMPVAMGNAGGGNAALNDKAAVIEIMDRLEAGEGEGTEKSALNLKEKAVGLATKNGIKHEGDDLKTLAGKLEAQLVNGSKSFGSAANLGAAAFTFLVFLLLNNYAKGFIKSVSILLALIIGTIFASFLGLVDASKVAEAKWFTVPMPFHFGVPQFDIAAILTMTLVGIIIMVESTGVFFALGEVSGKRVDGKVVRKGLLAEGVGAIFSGIFNSFNHSTFSQNVGLVFLTKVVSRYVVAFGGGILVILGLVPKIAAMTTMIPPAVLGGAMVPMFGMLMAASMQMMIKDDITKSSNQLIIGVGVGLSLACAGASVLTFDKLPQLAGMLIGSGPVVAGAACFLLNWWLNGANYDPVAEYEKNNEKASA